MRAPRSMAVGFVVAASALAPRTTRAADDPGVVEHPPFYVDIDFTPFNCGASVAAHFGYGIYAGAGFSLSPPITYNTFKRYPLELIEGHAFVRYEPFRFVQFDVGMRASYFQEFQFCIFEPCGPPPSGTLYGPYVAVAFGSRRFKLGPRVEMAQRSDTRESGVLLYPLMFRVELTP